MLKKWTRAALLAAMTAFLLVAGTVTSCSDGNSGGVEETQTYTVTFDSDGGSKVEPLTINSGETAAKPDDPTRDGYVFGGWYLGDSEFHFSTAITQNITLKAKWISATQVSASELAQKIAALTNETGTVTFKVNGEAGSSFFDDVKNALMTLAESGSTVLVSLDLSDVTGVTRVPTYAFCNRDSSSYTYTGCTNLTGIVLPDTVGTIDSSAFNSCSGLTSVTIPGNVTLIWSSAFENCENLVVTYKGTLAQWCQMSNGFSLLENAASITLDDVTDLKALTALTIPDNVESIGNYAFAYCTKLTSVKIPEGVKSIGSAFFYCSKNLAVTYGGTLAQWCVMDNDQYLLENAASITLDDVNDLKALTELTIPDNVESIGSYALAHCTKLTSVKISTGVKSIGGNAFYNSGLTSVEIPEGVESIDNFAFSYCKSLTSMTIGRGVTRIGVYVFSGCSALGNVTFNDTDGWYATSSSLYKDGTSINVSTPATNATNLKSTLTKDGLWVNKYLYKTATTEE